MEEMATERMTFTVPEDLKQKAQDRDDVNWSAVVSKAIEEKIAALEVADRIAERSEFTAEDVDELAAEIDAHLREHFDVGS